MEFEIILWIVIAAFVLQFFDAAAGMGYGSMTPLLILMGVDPLTAVFGVLATSAVLSFLTGFLHHTFKNVDFSFGGKSLKLTAVLAGFGLIGILAGIFLAEGVPDIYLEIYISLVLIVIGFLVLLKKWRKSAFSWGKIIALGSFAAFNKSITGGGYGPVLAGGQIISGVNSKKAVSITAMTEALISVAAIVVYLLTAGKSYIDSSQIVSMLIGGVLSTPLAVYAVKRFKTEVIKNTVGVLSVLFGIAVIIKLIL